jgi:hypothetical protein
VTGASPETKIPTLVVTGGITLITLVAIYVVFVSMLENRRATKKWEMDSRRLKKLKIPDVYREGEGEESMLQEKKEN